MSVDGVQVPLRVCAALIRRGERYLVCRRPEGASHGGWWEFPGGKLEAGEREREALVRELREELALEARVGPLVQRVQIVEGGARALIVAFFEAEIGDQEPRPRVHSECSWVEGARCDHLRLLPADRLVLPLIAGAGPVAPPPESDPVPDWDPSVRI